MRAVPAPSLAGLRCVISVQLIHSAFPPIGVGQWLFVLISEGTQIKSIWGVHHADSIRWIIVVWPRGRTLP
jgi:hypothetical protein